MKPFKSATVIITIFIGFQALFALAEEQKAYVKHVFDGDTVLVRLGWKDEKVRFLGIDTPEKAGPYTKKEFLGEKASARTRKLALGKTVTLVFGGNKLRDKYGRLLAYVILPNGKSLNEILLMEGLARAYKRFPHKMKQKFIRLERTARGKKLGIWSAIRNR